MITFENLVRSCLSITICIMAFFLTSCFYGFNHNKIPISYTGQINNLPGGEKEFWPDNGLKSAFIEYWNMRYSEGWRSAFEKEAPYFQEIVSRSLYENILKGSVTNQIAGIKVRSIQKITQYLYDIQFEMSLITPKKEQKEFYFTDRWVYAGNKWYHVINDKVLFPKAS